MRLWALITAFLLAVAPLHAQTQVPYTDQNPVAADPLTREIVEAFRAAELGEAARLAVHVINPQTGQTWIQINPHAPLRPASVLKLVTSAAALDILGSDRRFVTTIEATGPVVDGVLHGDLLIRGGGDPSLGPRFHDRPNNITGVLRDWARELRSQGIRSITGNIVGDGSRYANEPHAIGWEPLEFGEWYSAEVSALTFNDNAVDILWRGGRSTGSRASYTLRPDTDYVTIASAVRTSPASRTDTRIRHFRFRDSNEIRARGSIPPGERAYRFAAIHDPPRYTAHLLKHELERRGIDVRGSALNARHLDIGSPAANGGTENAEEPSFDVLLRHESPPLREFLPILLGDSHNLYAEILLREIALEMGREATFLEGANAVTQWLRRQDLNYPGFTMVDGSGLSPLTRMPARVGARLLRDIHRGEHAEAIREALPMPGTRSLQTRFQDGEFAPLHDNLRAKTGFIDGTHTMAGYLQNHEGTTYAFVIMLNDYDLALSLEARALLDRIVLKIYESGYLP